MVMVGDVLVGYDDGNEDVDDGGDDGKRHGNNAVSHKWRCFGLLRSAESTRRDGLYSLLSSTRKVLCAPESSCCFSDN